METFTEPFLDSEFEVKTSRSGGKGGQNVNKVSTKVQLVFNVNESRLLTDEQKKVLLEKLGDKLSQEGTVQVSVQQERSQLGNREIAKFKMYELLNACFVKRKKRKPTAPSQASVDKRLQEKKRNAELKKFRQADPEG